MFVQKKFLSPIVDLFTLRLLILPKTCSKFRNVFATHCTVHTLDDPIHLVLTDRQNSTNISETVGKCKFV